MANPFRKSAQVSENVDTGFGSRAADLGSRLINRDGTFNVQRRGMRFIDRLSIYHTLITMSWLQFYAMVILFFIVVNLIFAGIYMAIGVEHMAGFISNGTMSDFQEAFFFSAQTLTTVGYGRINPTDFWTSLVAALEALAGLMAFALATGLLYGRFARPVAMLIYSESMMVAPYRGITGLMFRLANTKDNLITNMRVEVMLSWNERGEDGKDSRKFYTLDLERAHVQFLTTSWTVVHPINTQSLLYGLTQEDVDKTDLEILVKLDGFDETSAQFVSARTSYKFYEIVWGGKFQSMSTRSTNGRQQLLDLDLISAYHQVSLPAMTPLVIPTEQVSVQP